MSLKQQLTDDMKHAMRGGDKARLAVIRLILAAIKQREIDDRITLDDAQTLTTLEKMLKQRRDSITQYAAAGREDLAALERAEMVVIETYLPAKLDESDIEAMINTAIAETNAHNARDLGKVLAKIKQEAAGRIDMAQVSAKVKARLS